MSKCNILMLAFFAFILVFDLVTKAVANSKLAVGESADFLPHFLGFLNVHNDGAAWGMFSGFGIILIIITFIFLFVYLWFFFTKHTDSTLLGITSGLVLGGTVGNLVDRLIHSTQGFYVRDFLNFEFMSFPVFNIADVALTIGVILLAVYFLFVYPKEYKENNAIMKKNNQSVGKHGEVFVEDLDAIEDRNFSVIKAIKAERISIKNNKSKSNKKEEKDKKDEKTQKNGKK